MSETRARRRIRLAVESRGHELVALEWEPVRAGGEMDVDAGGWLGVVRDQNTVWGGLGAGQVVEGYSVEEAVAWVDHFHKPPEPCPCDTSDRAIYNPTKTDRLSPLHEPTCRWYLRYELPWWQWARERRSERDLSEKGQATP